MKQSNSELLGKAFLFSIVLFVGIFFVQLAATLLMEYISAGEIENLTSNLHLIHLVFLSWFNFIFLIAVYLLFVYLEERTLKNIRLFFNFSALKQATIAVFLVIILCVVYIGTLKITDGANIIPQKPQQIYLILLLSFFTAFSEELVIRGYLLGIFISQQKILLGIFLSSFVFSILHIIVSNVTVLVLINIFLVGVFLAFITVWCRNIYFAVSFHMTYNFLDVFLDFNHILTENNHRIWKLEILSTNELITGGFNGMTGSIIFTIALLFFLVFAYLKKEKI